MTHRIAQYTFTDEEWRQLQEQRRLLDQGLAQEHGEQWLVENRRMLDAQWEASISMGLFSLDPPS